MVQMAQKTKIRKNSLTLKKVLSFWLPVIVWTTVIFIFSSRPTPVSAQIDWQDFIIKKTAHIVEYAILSTLLYRALVNSGVPKREAAIYSIILSATYGISDEVHQHFTPGREPRVRDVFFDLFGASLAIYLIYRYITKAPRVIKNWAKTLQIV